MQATDFFLPWLAIGLAAPLAGALVVRRHAAGEDVRPRAVAAAAVSLAAALGALVEWGSRGSAAPLVDPLDPGVLLFGWPLFGIDELSAWLWPFVALSFAAALLVAPRQALGTGLATRMLASLAILLALFACRHPVGIAALWVLSIAPLALELRAAASRRTSRVFERYMALSIALLLAGMLALALAPADASGLRTSGLAAVLAAAALRKGIFPLHSWVPEFFAGAPLGAALLYCVPQLAAYALLRIAAPEAPAGLLFGFGRAALATAVYGAGVALVQDDPRRAFGWLFLSQSALVMAGLDCSSELGLAGALALWISSGLSLGGFGLTLWVLEARRGPLSLRRFHGGYERMSLVAACFLVFGLASVGFPGTLGFVGQELLVDGAVASHPHVGVGVAIATALNGICVVRMYFALFCGARDRSTEPQRIRPREAVGFASLAALLVIGGLVPRPFLDSRARAAEELLQRRAAFPAGGPPAVDSARAGRGGIARLGPLGRACREDAMKLDLLYEVDCPKPWNAPHPQGQRQREQQAYREALEQIRLADRLGFHTIWAVEHHFREGRSHCPAPEVLLGALSQVTERIRLGFGVTLCPFGFTHPARIAEKVAAVDILSGGRVEWGTGRSTPMEQTAFHVDRARSRDQWREAIEVVCGMWREERFSWSSPTFEFPERVVTPKPVQDPHPPCWMAATSDGSAEVAGENALGLLSFSIMQPLERMAQQIQAYRKAQERAKPLTGVATNKVAAYTLVHCADSMQQAERNGIWKSVAWWYQNLAQFTIDWELVHLSAEEQNQIFPLMKPLLEGNIPIDHFHAADMIVVGDAERCLEKMKRYADLGVDQLICYVQFGYHPHASVMRTIEILGREVLPEIERYKPPVPKAELPPRTDPLAKFVD